MKQEYFPLKTMYRVDEDSSTITKVDVLMETQYFLTILTRRGKYRVARSTNNFAYFNTFSQAKQCILDTLTRKIEWHEKQIAKYTNQLQEVSANISETVEDI